MLTKGWSRFVKEKGLLPGDNVVFEKGLNGQLYIGYARTQSGVSHKLCKVSGALVKGKSPIQESNEQVFLEISE